MGANIFTDEFHATGYRLNMLIACIAGLGFLLFGYDQGVMSSLLTLPEFEAQFPYATAKGDSPTATGSPATQSLMVAIYELGALAGSIVIIFLGDRMGRKRSIFLGAGVMVIGAILQTSAYSYAQLVVGRIVTGLGNGMNTSTIPTWQSELAKPHMRGKLVMHEGMLIAGGIMISYWIDFAFYWVGGSARWRVPIAFQIIFALAIMALIFKCPESPRWLIKKGRYDEAAGMIGRLNAREIGDKATEDDIRNVQDSIDAQGGDKPFNFKEVFTGGKSQHFRRMALGFTAQAFQQLSGINLITYYSTVLFQNNLHFSAVKSRILAACNGTEYWMAAVVAIFLIERVGRRKLMIIGALGMSLSMVVLAITDADGGTKASVAGAVFLFVFNTFFALGWLGMTWLYPSEINPLRIRVQASAISTSSNWLFNFLIVMITPISFANIGYKTYVIFAILNAAFIPVIYFFFPETKGRSLEEMDVIFARAYNKGNKSPVWEEFKTEKLTGPALDQATKEAFAYNTTSSREKGQDRQSSETGSASATELDGTVHGSRDNSIKAGERAI